MYNNIIYCICQCNFILTRHKYLLAQYCCIDMRSIITKITKLSNPQQTARFSYLFTNLYKNSRISNDKMLTCCVRYNFIKIAQSLQGKIKKVHIKTPLQQIIQQLETLKKQQSLNQQKILEHLQSIQRSPLQPSQKISCRKYLTNIIYNKNVSDSFLLSSQAMQEVHKDQPFMELQTFLFVISREQSKQKPNYQLINDLYVKAFQNVSKKADQHQGEKIEALLCKNFGRYMVERGDKKKGITALQKSIQSHQQVIKQQSSRMNKFLNQITANNQQNKKKQKPQKQREILRLNALKQNIRRLIESMYETVHFYYSTQKSLSKAYNPKQREELLVTLCSLLFESLKAKQIVEGSHLYSRHYHRLKQIHLELEYAYSIIKNNFKRKKDILQQMEIFIQDCVRDMEDAKEYIQIQKEIFIAILSMELHLKRLQKGNNADLLKKQLTNLTLSIIQKGKIENKMSKEGILKLLAEFIKKNIN